MTRELIRTNARLRSHHFMPKIEKEKRW